MYMIDAVFITEAVERLLLLYNIGLSRLDFLKNPNVKNTSYGLVSPILKSPLIYCRGRGHFTPFTNNIFSNTSAVYHFRWMFYNLTVTVQGALIYCRGRRHFTGVFIECLQLFSVWYNYQKLFLLLLVNFNNLMLLKSRYVKCSHSWI